MVNDPDESSVRVVTTAPLGTAVPAEVPAVAAAAAPAPAGGARG